MCDNNKPDQKRGHHIIPPGYPNNSLSVALQLPRSLKLKTIALNELAIDRNGARTVICCNFNINEPTERCQQFGFCYNEEKSRGNLSESIFDELNKFPTKKNQNPDNIIDW
ncbi:9821_t:CDS:2, partial [Scutellospora calospora]